MMFIVATCLTIALFYAGMRFPKALFISVILCGAICVWATSQAIFAFEDASNVSANPKAPPKCGKNDACLADYARQLGRESEFHERRLFAALVVAAFSLASGLSVVAREKSRRKVAQKLKVLEDASEKHASMDEIRKLMRTEDETTGEAPQPREGNSASKETGASEVHEAEEVPHGRPKTRRRPAPLP